MIEKRKRKKIVSDYRKFWIFYETRQIFVSLQFVIRNDENEIIYSIDWDISLNKLLTTELLLMLQINVALRY